MATSSFNIGDLNSDIAALNSNITTMNNKITSMGDTIEIAHITTGGDSTVTHDLTQYRYIMFVYFSATFYRQSAIYVANIMTGSAKAGYDNLLDGSNRCYCLKTAYNLTTKVMNLSTLLPSTGTWASGSFYIYGIK